MLCPAVSGRRRPGPPDRPTHTEVRLIDSQVWNAYKGAVKRDELPVSAEWGQNDHGGDNYGRSVSTYIVVADDKMAKKLMREMDLGHEAYLWFSRPDSPQEWTEFNRVCPVRMTNGIYGCENDQWYNASAAAAGRRLRINK
eukprot:SAG22_NODE_52_length_24288_cov_15.594568_8_plen_141_part_00